MAERYCIQKLNSENYSIWSYRLKLMMIDEDIWDAIAAEKPDDSETAKLSRWKRMNDKALARIGLLSEDDQVLHIRNATTAKEAWEALKQYHQKSTLSSKVLLLKKVCRTVLSEDGDMETHVAEFSNCVNKLAAIGQNLPDDLLAALLLGSLPESYDILVKALESRPEKDITFQFVKGKLIDEFKKRKGTRDIRNSLESESAMKSVHQKNNKGLSPLSVNISCYFCKKTGHLKKDCRKYEAWKVKQNKANNVSENISDSKEKYFLAREVTPPMPSGVSQDSCYSAKTVKIDRKNFWLIDSGATSHISCSKSFFEQFNPSIRGKIQLADSEKYSEVLGMGSGSIKCTVNGKIKILKLENVLFVPSFGSSLISVKKLSTQGYDIKFRGYECNVIKDGHIQATGWAGKGATDLFEIETIVDTAHAAINAEHNHNCQHVWHRRFGHRDVNAIKELAEKGLATGINITDCGRYEVCDCCVKGKMARLPFPKEATNKTQAILDLLHTDVCGPMQTNSLGNKRYLMTVIDDFSRYTKVYFLSTKDEAAHKIKEFVEMAKTQLNKTPKCVRSDRGREYVNSNLRNYLKNRGIRIEYTAAYSPQQNGVAERKNRSLIEMSRCMLLDANMDKKYWAEAVNTANFLQNRLPTKATEKTPYELWHSRKPDVKDIHIFGCEAYVQIPNEKRRKLDDKAEKLIFIGYSEESKAFRFIDKGSNKPRVSRDVIFLDKFGYDDKNKVEVPSDNSQCQVMDFSTDDVIEADENIQTADSEGDSSTLTEDSSGESNYDTGVDDDSQENRTIRRSARENRGVPPNRYMAVTKLAQNFIEDPRSRREALSRPNKEKWQEAMDEEIRSLLQNNTWDVVPAPKDRDVVTCKWVFKTKTDEQSGADKYKARLVARGFSQKYGIDYDEVFAPVVKQTTFKVLLTIAGKENLAIKHFDAKSAFLNGDLKEEIYMSQPEGYERTDSKGNTLVCKLNKGIYGLKQAAKIWNEKVDEVLQSQHFIQSEADSCLYIKKTKEETIYIIVHVDDFLIAARKEQTIDKVASFLRTKFELTDLGKLQRYLGIEVRRNKYGIYCIKQTEYIQKILNRFGLNEVKISHVPLDVGYYKNDDQSQMENNENYQQLIGSLLYLSVNTRPDITASVSILSQKNKNPTKTDWTEVKRICRYLKGTMSNELVLGHKAEEEKLIGYADADWAENRSDRKSNSGYIFKFIGAPISWGCRKQSCVALSSTEAEYIALAEACQEAIWIKRLINDFTGKEQGATSIFEDNQSCIKLTDNRKINHRTKHIDTKYHFIKNLKAESIIDLKYCPTEEMLADMLTKPLSKVKLRKLAEKCGLRQIKNT